MTADHTPSPATDGLREAVEALADEWESGGSPLWRGIAAPSLRAVLATHPAPPSETATECEDGVFGSQDIADALGGRGPLSTIVGEWEPVEETQP